MHERKGRTKCEMLRVEKIEVFNFEGAIRGARNPMNSWAKSDSEYVDGKYVIGENDLDLMKRLVRAGSDERKFMRQILVSMDITAPLYWWKECDTYKVGTVANSCSTMHKIHASEFNISDFSVERVSGEAGKQLIYAIVDYLELNRKLFNETKQKRFWENMIQMLPSSYNQKRTITLNYEVLRNIYHARRHHKLEEWHTLCDAIEKMPYSELITMEAKVAK
jgi:hypothetical protein